MFQLPTPAIRGLAFLAGRRLGIAGAGGAFKLPCVAPPGVFELLMHRLLSRWPGLPPFSKLDR